MLYSHRYRLSSLQVAFACALFFASAAAPAGAASPSALCREASLRTFLVEGSQDEFHGKNLCSLDPASLPVKFQEAIRDAKEVHEKVAGAFGMSAEALFGSGVNLKIVAGAEGLNGTYRGDLKQVELGALANPRRWIDLSIYAHELGHWVADSKNTRVPELIRSSRSSFLLDETLADTVALAAFGATADLDPDLPACMVPRLIDGKQTYKAPLDYFAARAGTRGMKACCEAHRGRLNPAAEGACRFVDELVKKNPLRPLRPGLKFSVEAAIADFSQIDTHQIGVPVNSFLYALGKKLGRPVYQEFLLSAANARADSLLCRFEKDGKRGEALAIKVTPFANHLDAFYAGLKASERPLAERLMRDHDLRAAVELDEADLGERASAQGTDALFAAMDKNSSLRLNRKHRCYGPLKSLMTPEGKQLPAGCEVSCQPRF